MSCGSRCQTSRRPPSTCGCHGCESHRHGRGLGGGAGYASIVDAAVVVLTDERPFDDSVINGLVDEALKEMSKRQAKAFATARGAPKNHQICRMLEDIVVALTQVADLGSNIADKIGDSVAAAFRKRGNLKFLAAVTGAVAARVAGAVLKTVTTISGLDLLICKLQLTAMAACPNPSAHPSLETSCAVPFIRGLITTQILTGREPAAVK